MWVHAEGGPAHVTLCFAGEGDAAPSVAAFAWDAEGERLAVALDEQKPQSGGSRRIAVFATAHKPMLAMQHLGFAAQSTAQPGPDGTHRVQCSNNELIRMFPQSVSVDSPKMDLAECGVSVNGHHKTCVILEVQPRDIDLSA